jgi:hypothetical protein
MTTMTANARFVDVATDAAPSLTDLLNTYVETELSPAERMRRLDEFQSMSNELQDYVKLETGEPYPLAIIEKVAIEALPGFAAWLRTATAKGSAQ